MSSHLSTEEYLQQKVNPILEELVLELVKQKPASVEDFMIEWLRRNRNDGQIEAEVFSDDEIPDFELDQSKVARTSVSAEAYGQYNQKPQYQPFLIQKSQEQRDRIYKRIKQSFMFQVLNEQELQLIIDAMSEKIFNADDVIIKQGEPGDELYIIDSGELDCFKALKKDEQPTFLKSYSPGESFGELALLYNSPRAATIIAKTKSTLFTLDRETFNFFVRDKSMKQRQKYEDFLSQVELLHEVDPYERLQIADALHPAQYNGGEYIVKEGDRGDIFFFLELGEAKAFKNVDGVQNEVYEYKSGDYFGELSLLRDAPRAASVIAQTKCNVVSLDRNSFRRLLGPLEHILKRNLKRYEKYMV